MFSPNFNHVNVAPSTGSNILNERWHNHKCMLTFSSNINSFSAEGLACFNQDREDFTGDMLPVSTWYICWYSLAYLVVKGIGLCFSLFMKADLSQLSILLLIVLPELAVSHP